MSGHKYHNAKEVLNRMNPPANMVRLGDTLQEIIDNQKAIIQRMNALLAKLDADAGVTDEDYEETLALDIEIRDLQDRL